MDKPLEFQYMMISHDMDHLLADRRVAHENRQYIDLCSLRPFSLLDLRTNAVVARRPFVFHGSCRRYGHYRLQHLF